MEAAEMPRRQRRMIHGVLVALDAPDLSDKPWVVDAIDINANGMGLVLPPEIAEGTEVFLSFKLDDRIEFSRMPARVRHQLGASGGVTFHPWPSSERSKLLEYLVSWYERDL
ncbi:MAG: PilZ domain-containing protein [Holophagales bacterium]|nr:PilZ domain-containing protein [Holophagales bacterium]